MADGLEALQILRMFLGKKWLMSINNITVKLIESNAKIEQDINLAASIEVNKKIKRNVRKVEKKLTIATKNWILGSPEVTSLKEEGVFYSLNAQFGFPLGFSDSAVEAVANAVASSVRVRLKRFDIKLKTGGVEFFVQPSNFANLLGLPEAVLQTSTSSLPWLDWLLLKGDTIIVARYGVKYKAGTGRSGQATMKLNYNAPYKVDSQFSGTSTNNFITESIESANDEIMGILARYI